jgi:uncharacterized protein YdhG (YjbR/CyaY superfamily)
MTQDEIIEMARTSGFMPAHNNRVQHFAKLVAAKEREACAKVCYELPWKDMTHIPSNLAFAAAIRARGEA